MCIINQNQVLLLKTNNSRGAFWQNITGHVELNETFLQAAEREVFEETKIGHEHIIDLKKEFFFIYQYKNNNQEKSYLIILKLTKNPNVFIDENEHQDFKWVDINQITKNDFLHPSNYDVFIASKNIIIGNNK